MGDTFYINTVFKAHNSFGDIYNEQTNNFKHVSSDFYKYLLFATCFVRFQ